MIATTSPSSISWSLFVSRRNAVAADARNISPSPTPTIERALDPRADELLRMVAVDDDEREVALELLVGGAHGRSQIARRSAARRGATTTSASVSVLNSWPSSPSEAFSSRKFSTIPFRTTAIFDSSQPVSGCAFCSRHLAVRRPARVAEPGRGLRAVVLRDLLQEGEIADGPDVVEAVILEQREARRVVARGTRAARGRG